MSQIEIKNLTKKFIQGSNEIYAVNNVSMQIEKGEMVRLQSSPVRERQHCSI